MKLIISIVWYYKNNIYRMFDIKFTYDGKKIIFSSETRRKTLKDVVDWLHNYEDDMNVDITSNVIDIMQDLIDDDDELDIECFTDGYVKLKHDGIKSTNNDIGLYICSNSNDSWMLDNDITNHKELDYKKLIPYLQRVIDYIESEDRSVFIEFEWTIIEGRDSPENPYSLGRMNFEYRLPNGEINKELNTIPDNNYDSIIMKFKLKI